MYRTVEQATAAMVAKYDDLRKAIQRAQQYCHKAKSEESFDFWASVVEELQKLKPKKQYKFQSKEE
ncbi:hypothetical protein [Aeromonas sp. 1HA1]|uniref:hypothetical protein n=1 Tax=Aeromonas sp. 1HA1 TaxID=2699193 RepID=UPI0023DDB196|nr:hypothetical protein [Aeromonas sp. 1HA1]MDF2413907.1 hypothetical protein [Aeromonas sp. 1HA1]